MKHNIWLIIAGTLSAAAALLHIAVIVGGPDWYRFFGAGEEMARGAERGSLTPPILTMAIAAILFLLALYAFSGAGLIRRLPLLRMALITISAIYLLRGLIVIPLLIMRPGTVNTFGVWSSLIVLVYGLAYAIGTYKAWPVLKPPVTLPDSAADR